MKFVTLRAHSPTRGDLHKPLETEIRHDKINPDPERNTMRTDTGTSADGPAGAGTGVAGDNSVCPG